MKDIVIIAEVVLFTAFAYFGIQYKRIVSEKKTSHISGIVPRGWKQIVCYIAIPTTLVVTAYMLNWFYLSDVFFTTKRLLLVSLLWPVAAFDYKEYRIPNKLVLFALLGRLLILVFELIFRTSTILATLINEGIAVVGAAVVCLICMLLSRGSLGMGDFKLMIAMAALLGIEGIYYSMFASIFAAFVVAIVLLITKKKGRKDHMPFAPSILVGTIISLILCGV